MLIVGHEGIFDDEPSDITGGIGIYSIDPSAVPEPTVFAAIFDLCAVAFVGCCRKR